VSNSGKRLITCTALGCVSGLLASVAATALLSVFLSATEGGGDYFALIRLGIIGGLPVGLVTGAYLGFLELRYSTISLSAALVGAFLGPVLGYAIALLMLGLFMHGGDGP
jgi:hypothetical protein